MILFGDAQGAGARHLQHGQQALIYDRDNKLIGPGKLAHAGVGIVIYCAGLGAVNSPPSDGALTPDASSTVVNHVNIRWSKRDSVLRRTAGGNGGRV
jgi:uncharacterized protein (TIGR03437 family)